MLLDEGGYKRTDGNDVKTLVPCQFQRRSRELSCESTTFERRRHLSVDEHQTAISVVPIPQGGDTLCGSHLEAMRGLVVDDLDVVRLERQSAVTRARDGPCGSVARRKGLL